MYQLYLIAALMISSLRHNLSSIEKRDYSLSNPPINQTATGAHSLVTELLTEIA